MRVFVTGGSGFIGSSVVRALVGAGHQVLCLVRETSRTARLAGLPLERIRGDVRDIASLRAPMARCDGTIHLAAPGGWAGDQPVMLKEVIEDGTRNVLDVASSLRDHRVVLVSSTAAINASDTPQIFDERATFAIDESTMPYAHAKHRAEEIAFDAFARGMPVIIVNPAEVYGPGDTELVSASNLIDLATSMPVLVCHGGTSVVHVSDVAAGIVAALERGRPGERYILGGENLTIRQLAELVLELVNRRAPILTVPSAPARRVARMAIALRLRLPFNPRVVPYATRYWFVDNSKARSELTVSFRNARETIRSTLEWLADAGYLASQPSLRRSPTPSDSAEQTNKGS